jgi:PAS domain S-box-containing protein
MRIDAIQTAIYDYEADVRGFAITGNPVFIKDTQGKKLKIHTAINELEKQKEQNIHWNIDALESLVVKKIQFSDSIITATKRSPIEANNLIASLRGKNLTDAIDTVLDQMKNEQQALLDKKNYETEIANDTRFIATVVLSFLAFLFLLYILRNIGREYHLRKVAEDVARQSEQKYKDLVENSSFISYVIDLNGTLTYASGKCKELLGFTAEELMGENMINFIVPEWRERISDFYASLVNRQTLESIIEFPVVCKKGEVKWIEQSVVLIEENGIPKGFQSIAKDISEKKFAEKLLIEAETNLHSKQKEYNERLQAILDNIPMIIFLKDLQGNFLMVNKEFHQTFNTTDENVIGKPVVHVHKSVNAANRFIEIDEEIKNTLQPKEVEDLLITSKGERNMLIVKFPLLDKNNTLFSIGGIGKDITENVRQRQQMIKARVRAERAEKLQEEFLANMSHEIRTPMNGIIGMTNLLSSTSLNGEQDEYVQLIRESSEILLSLINDILDLSKIKAGRMGLETIDFNINDTLDTILATHKIKARQKNICLTKEVDPTLPAIIKGDQHKLVQILNNLVSNAIKFTEEGKVTVALRVLESDSKSVKINLAVSDTGIGIDSKNQKLIFESFAQAGHDMIRRFGGTGLGLAITKKLVELQGGAIVVESRPDQGSKFSFSIRYALSEIKELPNKVIEGIPSGTNVEQLRGKNILLVEDNLINQKVTSQILRKVGMYVDIANNGKEAVEMLETGKDYEAILMDLQMAEMDGFQATTYIRKKLHLTTPIIAMTASALRDERSKCIQVGMNEYLAKPFSPSVLFYHLNRFTTGASEAIPVHTKECKEEKSYSLEYLDEMDDEEYSCEVLELFLESTPVTLKEIKELILRSEGQEVYKKAHALKSSLGILQLNQLLSMMTEIEQLAKKEEQFDKMKNIVDEAHRQYNLVRPMIESEFNSIKHKTSNIQ